MTEHAARMIERIVLGLLAAGGLGTAAGDNFIFDGDERAGADLPHIVRLYGEAMVDLDQCRRGN